MWTPYQIEIVLHHYCSKAPFPRRDAPAYGSTVADLVHDGILIDSKDGTAIAATEMGNALVEMWCNTPLPVQRFIDPRFERTALETKEGRG